jgi:hypothetical protein
METQQMQIFGCHRGYQQQVINHRYNMISRGEMSTRREKQRLWYEQRDIIPRINQDYSVTHNRHNITLIGHHFCNRTWSTINSRRHHRSIS